ncbi:MAG: hypothetical protein RLY67_1121, partial [Pseudomonadota bacterium]
MPLLTDKPRRRMAAPARRNGRSGPMAAATETPFADFVWVAWLLAALMLGLSLMSFTPADPGWFQNSSVPESGNWLGRVGAALADGFLFFFGLSAYWFVFLGLI